MSRARSVSQLIGANTALGNTTITGALNVSTNTATIGTSLYAVSNGNVGFGVSSPTTKIMVGYSNANAANKIAIGSSTGYQAFLDYNSGNEVFTIENTSDYSAGAIAFNVNAAERMRIDINGRITMPYQPSFHAKGGDNTVNAVIAFNNAVHNTGSHYSTSTGRFTAPITGTYYFSAGMLQNGSANSNQPEIGIRVNGTYYVRSQGQYQAGANWGYAIVCAVIRLTASDYVDAFYGGSASAYGSDYSHFCGYLIG